MILILGIETSCDETSAAIVDGEGNVLSNTVFSQVEMHSIYGGIVPELASRDHALKIGDVVREAISRAGVSIGDITHLGVTSGPGLMGCLLVGLSFGKAFALARDIPLIGVDHVRAHLFSVSRIPDFPFVGLVVSGGHTSIYLVKSIDDIKMMSSTVDDAAGEVFDKAARSVGLGYPGGKELSEIARGGNPEAVKFTKPVIKGRESDFSFSGLKTAVISRLRDAGSDEVKDILASFQEVICQILVEKLIKIARENNIKDIVIGGGVAANWRLREMLTEESEKNGLISWLVPVEYCTDNAAMVASYARLLIKENETRFTRQMSKLTAYSTIRK